MVRSRIGWVLLAMGVMAEAEAAPSAAETWVVMPVRAEAPPPRDPTLLRLSVPLARAVSESVRAEVRLVERDTRDRRCADDGWRCPDEVAAIMDVDRVVSLHLDARHQRLKVQVFAARLGVVAETTVACDSREGRVACNTEALAEFVEMAAQAPLPKPAPVELPL